MSEHTFLFRLIIVIDYAFNVLTGGGFQTCFSTRCYFNEQTKGGKFWPITRRVVDKIMFEKYHCKKSYYWEMRKKQQWITNHKLGD